MQTSQPVMSVITIALEVLGSLTHPRTDGHLPSHKVKAARNHSHHARWCHFRTTKYIYIKHCSCISLWSIVWSANNDFHLFIHWWTKYNKRCEVCFMGIKKKRKKKINTTLHTMNTWNHTHLIEHFQENATNSSGLNMIDFMKSLLLKLAV